MDMQFFCKDMPEEQCQLARLPNVTFDLYGNWCFCRPKGATFSDVTRQ